MRPIAHRALAIAAAALALAGAPADAPAQALPSGSRGGAGAAAPVSGFDVERVADGVYAFVRREPEGLANQANTLVVVCDSDVVVVDAQYTRAATAGVIAAIRSLTPLPVRYVVNTHWHDDHVAGNQVYRDAFPGVEFIAHEDTRRDLATLGAANRRAQLAGAPPVAARFERLMAMGLGADSTPLAPSERAALASAVAITRQYVAEAPGFRETLPTLTFRDRLTLVRGRRTVQVLWLGRGNTRGDAVVWLPAERVVATGDLVVAPVPFAFDAYVGEWIGALDAIRALGPAVIVPGHGPPMRDDAYLRRVVEMLSDVRSQASAAQASGATLEQALRRVALPDARRAVAHGDKWLDFMFTRFFLAPAVARAYQEAAGRLDAPAPPPAP